MHSMSMPGKARSKKPAQSCRHSRDHPAAGTETHRQHTGHWARAQPEIRPTSKLENEQQTLPSQIVWCSFFQRMYRKRSRTRVNWEMVFASADPLGGTVPVRAGACPSCRDSCGSPKRIFFPEQPRGPSLTVLSRAAQGGDPHRDTRPSRGPPLPSRPGKASGRSPPSPPIPRISWTHITPRSS